MAYPTGLRDAVYQLRAQGYTLRDIETQLKSLFPGVTPPDYSTLSRWLSDPEASALVQQETTRLRAAYVNGAREVVPKMFESIAAHLETNETAKVRDLSQAMAAVTRGIVADRVEVSPDRKVDALEELASIAARHGLRIGEAATTKSGDTES